MDAEEYHTFAVKTLEGRRPVDCRVAIGRAYYAAFGVAVRLLRDCGCTIHENANCHGEVRNFLSYVQSDERIADAYDWIEQSKSLRNKADYELNNPKPEGHATAMAYVKDAGICISQLREALAADRDSFRAKFLEYQAKIGGQR